MKKSLLFLSLGALTISASAQSTARVQAIHNSADAAADTVDVYLTTPIGSSLLIEDFAFRTASPFIDAPAGVNITIGIAPKNSSSVNDTISGASFNYNLSATSTYVLIAEGIVSPTGYSPAKPFDMAVYSMGQEAAATMGNTDVLVHHGSTDAPTVDVDEVTAGNLVNDASYGDFAGYLPLATADYQLQVKNAAGTVVVASYDAPLATLNLIDSAIIVLASGFLDPSVNSNGPAFGLYVALPSGGNLIALPPSVSTGLAELSNQKDLNIYPNPAQNNITIQNLELDRAKVTITDLTGKVVNSSLYNINSNNINISNLSQGSYQLTITDNNKVIGNSKFVKF